MTQDQYQCLNKKQRSQYAAIQLKQSHENNYL